MVAATVRSGGLTPSDLGAAEEWLAFNASVRREGERMVVCPFCRGVASSEVEVRGTVEGFDEDPRARRRLPRGFEGVANGPHYVLGPWIGLL